MNLRRIAPLIQMEKSIMQKQVTVAFFARRFPREDWSMEIPEEKLTKFFDELAAEFGPLGVQVERVDDPAVTMEIRGYGDLLNSVRIRSPKDGLGNLCLGHIIGQSANRDLFEDIHRGVSRVAFAPETVEPEGSDKIVCHNCGCGC